VAGLGVQRGWWGGVSWGAGLPGVRKQAVVRRSYASRYAMSVPAADAYRPVAPGRAVSVL